MCGELEDEASPEEEAHGRFVAHAHSFLAKLRAQGKPDDVTHAYLDRLFRELLLAAIDDRRAPREMTGYQRLAMEPLVFARLAGQAAWPVAADANDVDFRFDGHGKVRMGLVISNPSNHRDTEDTEKYKTG